MTDELTRRFVHASGAMLPGLAVVGAPWHVVQGVSLIILGAVLILEGLRLHANFNWWLFDRLTRPYEQDNLAGYALYSISMALVAFLFPPSIAIAAMLMLALADPVGGLLAGSDPTPVKRWSALLGTFLVATVIALPLLPIPAAVVAAVVVALADGVFLRIRGYVLDDNITIPLGAALSAWLVLSLLS